MEKNIEYYHRNPLERLTEIESEQETAYAELLAVHAAKAEFERVPSYCERFKNEKLLSTEEE